MIQLGFWTGAKQAWRTALVTTASALALGGPGVVQAQDATPASSPSSISAVAIINADGQQIGTVVGSDFNGVVELTITVKNLEPGEHGLHIHETGTCDPGGEEPFASAGDHFNPDDSAHGPGMATVEVQVQEPEAGAATPTAEAVMASPVAGVESHAGDLGNLAVPDAGAVTAMITTESVTFAAGAENSLADDDGSALVIHENADDLATDPSGESGDPIACAVLFPSTSATPAASPEA